MSDPKYTYLLVNLASILFPFLFSFHPKSDFSKKWRHLWIAILIPGVIFLVWDEWFTQLGIWGFNESYLSGIYIGSLPIEEILFFICIPYACVFTYEALNYLVKSDFLDHSQSYISATLILGSALLAAANSNKWYTCTTFLGLALLVFALQFIWKVNFLGKFYFSYLFLLIPFFIVNGILTGSWLKEPVVWYNDSENLQIRLGTIPLEDTFYGMLLILMNVSILEWLQGKRSTAQT
jgi:lycopene cyclase domain-containing protein